MGYDVVHADELERAGPGGVGARRGSYEARGPF
jgi:hypothetical protein